MSIDASYHPGSTEINNHVTNADGFGVGWYHNNTFIDKSYATGINTAAVFKDTLPAWSNTNLREICAATRSNCIVAHVRAASKNTGVSQQNCHPFKAGRLLFCHNGRIADYIKVRRALTSQLTDEAFVNVRGTTDSEGIFALMLTFLSKDGASDESPFTQTEPFGHKRLVAAVKKTMRAIESLMHEAGLTETYNTLNFSLTDGDTLVVTRFCNKNPNVPPPSLYFAFGNAQRLNDELISEDPILFASQQNSTSTDDLNETDRSSHGGFDYSGSDNMYDEKAIDLEHHESRPGRLYSEVDPVTACFIVASTPLTRTHTWHHMHKNSIMWYTRGQSYPELRLLQERTMSLY